MESSHPVETPAPRESLIARALANWSPDNAQEAFDYLRQLAEADSDKARAYGELGEWLQAQERREPALEYLTKAVALAPDDARLRTTLGSVHLELGQLVAARPHFERAVALAPDLVAAWVNLATTLQMLGEPRGARAAYLCACELKPDFLYARLQALSIAREFLWWEDWDRQIELLAATSPTPDNTAPQLDLLYLPLSPALLRTHAEAYAAERARQLPVAPGVLQRAAPGERIRVGYVSNEFRRHATGTLAVEVLELHDRKKFDVHVYDWGVDDRSITERRARAAATFHDIGPLDAWQAAEKIAADGIDVLIDLKGYTQDPRLEIFAYRPAPVQMSWLAYPGTLGATFIDYLVADEFIIPRGAEAAYSERIIRLPDTYQPNDRERRSAAPKSRAKHGLPAHGVVYGYLGKASKLTPAMFDDWMAVLRAVPDSVLWMLIEKDETRRSVLKEAARRGVTADRMIFTGPLSYGDHLARFKMIDVALDTTPWGSHTTASEALWAGCLVVTRTGDTFASRVAGSLLRAAGLPELVTESAEDWRRLAIELGTDHERRQALRNRLAATRRTCALFDTARFVRNLENAFEATISRARQGLPPTHIDVRSDGIVEKH